MILMIDWGNTFLKFVALDSFDDKPSDIEGITQIANPAELGIVSEIAFSQILIASVRSEQDNQKLVEWIKQQTCSLDAPLIYIAKASPQALGVTCGYQATETLGVDRWLYILAASQKSRSVGIISIGSAITLDIVVDNQHLGGQIVAGRQLMFDSLNRTGKVRPLNDSGQSQFLNFGHADANFGKTREDLNQNNAKLGQSTTDCVNWGLESLIQGYLQSIITQFESQYKIQQWLITGGGGQYWCSRLKTEGAALTFNPGLVFDGLVRLFLAENRTNNESSNSPRPQDNH